MPLHNACSFGHYEVTELLLKRGALVNAADLWKFTPLHEAAAKGKYDICKLLLQVWSSILNRKSVYPSFILSAWFSSPQYDYANLQGIL